MAASSRESKARSSAGGRLLLAALAASALALVAFAAFGQAAPSLSNVTLTLVDPKSHDVVTDSAAPPGSVVGVKVDATLGASDKWAATTLAIGDGPAGSCQSLGHTNTGSGGSGKAYTEYVSSVTLPETGPGSVTVRLYSDDKCASALGQPQSAPFTIKRVEANPTLSPHCDMKVALVLDESYSIYSTPSDHSGVTNVRKGATAFVNGLVNTGAEVAVVEFNSQARTVTLGGKTYNPVDSAFVSGPFSQYINATAPSGDTYDPAKYSSPNYYTNWQDAFVKARALQPELVVYLTDGDPTARNIASSPGFETAFTNGSYSVLNPAFDEANNLKSAQSARGHVFVIGVGAGLSSANSQVRIRAISGQNQYPQHDLIGADYTLITDFSQLQEALAQMGHALCSVRVHVTKLVDDSGNGKYTAANGWEFSGEVTVSGQSNNNYRWLSPGQETGPPSGGNTRTDSTANKLGADGRLDFTWLPFPTTLTSQIVLTDKGRDGYHFAGVTCTKNTKPLEVQSDSATGKVTITGLAINDDVNCDFKDQKDTGTLKVAKKFVGTPTSVSLLINGDKKKTSDELTFQTESVTLPVGTQQVSEQFTDPDLAPLYDSSYLCKDADGNPLKSGQGTDVAEGVPLKAGADVTCTFTNKKDTSVVIKKVADPTEVDEPGGEVTFTVTVTNTTNAAVTLTSLVDDVFGNLDSSSTDHSWTSSTCKTGGSLAAKDTVEGGGPDTYTCSFVGNVTATPAKAHEDTVTVTITDKSGEKATDDSTATVNGRDVLPSIKVTKSADPGVLEGGGPVTYTAVIENTSAADALTIDQLADSIYGNLINGLHKASCKYGDADVNLPYNLPVGESLVCSFQVTVTTSQTDTITASGIDGEANRVTDSSDAIVTVTPPPTPTPPTPTPPTPTPPTPTPPTPAPPSPAPPAPTPEPTPPAPPTPAPPGPPVINLAVDKRAPATAHLDVGGRAAFAYDIRVRNDGPDTAPKVSLQDQAPAGVRFVKVTHQPSQTSCTIGGGGATLTCDLGDLIPAQSVDVQVDVAVKAAPGSVTNKATASCKPEPTAPCQADDSATTRLLAPFRPPAVKPRPPAVKPKPPAPKPKPPAAKPKPPAAKPPAPKPKPPAAKPKPKPPAVELPPPAKHPAVTCQTITVSTKTLIASRKPQKLVLTVKKGASRAPGATIVFRGPGIARIVHAGSNGVAAVTLKPPKPGVLTVSVRRLRACQIQQIGIAKPKKPPITG
jgi:uncharacterized repeat protein (TIGR01451 family)